MCLCLNLKCSKIRLGLQASLIPKFSRGNTPDAYFHSPAEFRTSTKSEAVIGRVHSSYRSVGRALYSVGHLVTS